MVELFLAWSVCLPFDNPSAMGPSRSDAVVEVRYYRSRMKHGYTVAVSRVRFRDGTVRCIFMIEREEPAAIWLLREVMPVNVRFYSADSTPLRARREFVRLDRRFVGSITNSTSASLEVLAPPDAASFCVELVGFDIRTPTVPFR